MKKLFYLLSLVLLATLLWQGCENDDLPGSIYGTVVDKATGEPIKSAGVELSPSGLKTVTGSEGQFEFTQLNPGSYTLLVTKTGYFDYASNTIVVESAQTAKGDVQIEKVPISLKVVDDKNVEISTIDFGDSESDIIRSFNIFNDGSDVLEWEITNTTQWIDSISKVQGETRANQKTPIVVRIDRNKLKEGENKTNIQITSSNGSKELTIKVTNNRKAISLNILECSDITGTAAVFNAEIINEGNPKYTERGFVYAKTSDPTIENTIQKLTVAVTDDPNFSIQATKLETKATYYVRAYAVNALGLVYSTNQVSFEVNPAYPSLTTKEVKNLNIVDGTAIFNGEILSVGDPAYTERGFVYGTVPNPTIDDTKKIVSGTGTGTYSANITGLTEGKVYYVRAYATNVKGTAYGTDVIVNCVAKSPVLTTNEVTNINISAGTATFVGNVESFGDLPCIERGFVYSEVNYPTVDDTKLLVSGTEVGDFRKNVTGLQEGKVYYVRAFVTNRKGTIYGEEVSCNFVATMPVVETISVSDKNISSGIATFKGNVVSLGDLGYTERGFVYGIVHNPTIDDTKITASGSGLGEFTANASELVEGKTYYIRAYATNSKGTVYGEEIEMDYTAAMPVVKTVSIVSKNIAEGVATFKGNVVSLGDLACTERGFVYSTTNTPTIDNNKVTASGTGTGTFTASASQLQEGKTYYIRAFVTNKKGTVYGEELTMDYTAVMPIVKTVSVVSKNIAEGVATFKGEVVSLGDLGYTERGFAYATVHNPTIGDNKLTASGSGTGEFSANATQLEEGKVYYIRAYATNSKGTVYGEEVSADFNAIMPIVSTQAVTGKIIAQGVATLNGTIESKGDPAYTQRGFVYGVAHSPTLDDATVVNVSGTNTGAYTYNLSNLTMGSVYYVRAFATSSKGTAYGSEVTLDFNAVMPEVTIVSVEVQDATTAYFIGKITNVGDPEYTERGFIYGTMQTPMIDDADVTTIVVSKNSSNQFEKQVKISGLDKSTFYVRAYAKSSVGVSYGTILKLEHPDHAAYIALPTFTHNSYTYRVYPELNSLMDWEQAVDACDNLTGAGYSDWILPSREELRSMYIYNNEIGGFNKQINAFYWSSTEYYPYNQAYGINFINGTEEIEAISKKYRVRCIRKE